MGRQTLALTGMAPRVSLIGILFDAVLYGMLNTEICSECKRPVGDHTANDLFSCNLEKAKRQKSISEDEAAESFNKIKSGEYARMKQNKEN